MTKQIKGKASIIELMPPKIRKILISIEGISSLICNRRTPEGIQKKMNPQRDHDVEFKNALYPKVNDHYTFPASGLKRATVSVAKTYCTSINKSQVTGIYFIPVDYVEIVGDEPMSFLSVVLIQGKAIVKARAEFKKWSMAIPIEFDESGPLTVDNIVNLFNKAGYHIGIGDWRPEKKGGSHGRFKVVEVKEIK